MGTRHLSITIALAFPVWLGYIIFSTLKNINFFLSHLVPLGTPYPLIPFIVLIEIIRRAIRPITLSVRLAANIIGAFINSSYEGAISRSILSDYNINPIWSIFINFTRASRIIY